MTSIRNLFNKLKKPNENEIVLDYFQDYSKSTDAADEVILNFNQKMEEPLHVLIQNFIDHPDDDPQSIIFISERIKLHDKKFTYDEELNKALSQHILNLTNNLSSRYKDIDKKNRSYLILAFIYQYGCGNYLIDREKAINYYDHIKDIYPIALANFGSMLEKLFFQSEQVDPNEIISCYQQGSKLKETHAAIHLGRLHKTGYIIEKNLKKAKDLFTEAASSRNPYALTELGILYYSGLGVKKNLKVAEEYFKRAAIFGDPRGLNELATLYYDRAFKRIRLDPEENFKSQTTLLFTKAEEYVTLAAKYGCVEAMKNGGRMHHLGFTHDPNNEIAADYYRHFLIFENDNIDHLFNDLLTKSEYRINIYENNKIIITSVSANHNDAAIFYYWAMASNQLDILKHAFYADAKVTSSLFDKELNCHLTKKSALNLMTEYNKMNHKILDPIEAKINALTNPPTLPHHRKHLKKTRSQSNPGRISNNNSLYKTTHKLSVLEGTRTKSSDSEKLSPKQPIDVTFFKKKEESSSLSSSEEEQLTLNKRKNKI